MIRKCKYFSSIFLLMIHAFCHGQSIRIIYDFVPNFEMILERAPSMAQIDEVDRYSLLITDQKAKFSLDSIMIKSYPPKHKKFQPALELYVDFKESRWMNCSGRFKDGYCLEIKLEDQINRTITWNWQITNEKKEIVGMECTKAVWLEHIVWFTEEIPLAISPGEKQFCLPGAVLQYENSSEKYTAIQIEKVNEMVTFPNKMSTDEEDTIKKTFSEMGTGSSKNIYLISNESKFNEWIHIRYH
ncbi:MAG TPA: GLPGLI family protein [Saprospiraceae bacterium]|nr:GLPGLI family protein [Saprospiraceae bacterium]HPN68107.1 GLPGLI family protein [Saprospiraceae bacterium]